MITSLHLDLLKDDERLSPNPIRLRVVFPLVGIVLVAGTLFWWSALTFKVRAAATQKTTAETNISSLKNAHDEILRLREEEKEMSASLEQLNYYLHSRIRFSEALASLPAHIPLDLQVTEMRVPPPPPFVPDAKSLLSGPTNTLEGVTLKLSGKAGGKRPTEVVNALLKAIATSTDFTNLIQNAYIPKGAVRQDTSRGGRASDTLLFEINCECTPRRFQ